jgi:hypothetical protein
MLAALKIAAGARAPTAIPLACARQARRTMPARLAGRRLRARLAPPLLITVVALGSVALPAAAQPGAAWSPHLLLGGRPVQLATRHPPAGGVPLMADSAGWPSYLPGSKGGRIGLRKKPLPYFGLGWTASLGHRLILNNDAGMMFEGRPEFTAGSHGPVPLPDAVMQRMEAAAASGRLRWQPVVTASLAYQF